MSETLRDHTIAWLDSIGADGLMMPNGMISVVKDHIGNINHFHADLVPAYRHADGSCHVEAEYPCPKCERFNDPVRMCKCPRYMKWSDWLAAKDRGVTPEQIVVEE
jgi:hypothetical protein